MAIGKDTKLSIVIEAEADDNGFVNLSSHVKELEKSVDSLKKKTEPATSAFGAFKGAMKSVMDVMGPINQGLELGRKLFGFAKDGLEAYAKTSREAAKDVNALTTEFAFYKQTIMAGVGEAAVELGKAAFSFDQAAEALRRGGEAGFGKAYGDITKQWNGLTDSALDAVKVFGDLGDNLQGTFGVITDKVAKNATAHMEAAVARARQLAEEYKKIGQALLGNETPSQRAIRQGAQSRAEFQAGIDRDVQAMYEEEALARSRAIGDPSVTMDRVRAAGQQMAELRANWAAQQKQNQASALEQMFGPIEEFNAYATAFGTLQTATQSAMSAWISGSMSLSLAVKKGIGDALGALSSQLAVEALRHGAYAIGSLAFGDFAGAGRHGAAAGAFGLGAAAAAAAAKKLGGSVQAELAAAKDAEKAAAAGGASAATSRSSGAGSDSGAGGTGQTINATIVYGEMFYRQSTRMRQHDAEQFVKAALGTSYSENH